MMGKKNRKNRHKVTSTLDIPVTAQMTELLQTTVVSEQSTETEEEQVKLKLTVEPTSEEQGQTEEENTEIDSQEIPEENIMDVTRVLEIPLSDTVQAALDKDTQDEDEDQDEQIEQDEDLPYFSSRTVIHSAVVTDGSEDEDEETEVNLQIDVDDEEIEQEDESELETVESEDEGDEESDVGEELDYEDFTEEEPENSIITKAVQEITDAEDAEFKAQAAVAIDARNEREQERLELAAKYCHIHIRPRVEMGTPDNPRWAHPNNGGLTIAYIPPESKANVIRISIAWCSRKDNFEKKIGAYVAAKAFESGFSIPFVLGKKGNYAAQLRDLFTPIVNAAFRK
jgi:hypothetical protein